MATSRIQGSSLAPDDKVKRSSQLSGVAIPLKGRGANQDRSMNMGCPVANYRAVSFASPQPPIQCFWRRDTRPDSALGVQVRRAVFQSSKPPVSSFSAPGRRRCKRGKSRATAEGPRQLAERT